MKFSFNFLSERRGSKNYTMRKATDCYTSFCWFTSTLYNFLFKVSPQLRSIISLLARAGCVVSINLELFFFHMLYLLLAES